jgi:hypothetical protein
LPVPRQASAAGNVSRPMHGSERSAGLPSERSPSTRPGFLAREGILAIRWHLGASANPASSASQLRRAEPEMSRNGALRLVSPTARRGDRREDRGECARPIANPGRQVARGSEGTPRDPRGVTPWRVATLRRPAVWWADPARGRGHQSDRLSSMYLSSIPARSK